MQEHIKYLMSGKLGDFFHGLSVLKYNFDTQNQKAKIYITDDERRLFELGSEKTCNDLKDILLSQPYVESIEMLSHKNTEDMINMTRHLVKGYYTKKRIYYNLSWNEMLFNEYIQEKLLPPKEYTWLRPTAHIKRYEEYLILNRSYNHAWCEKYYNKLLYEKYIFNSTFKKIGFICYDNTQYDMFPFNKNVELIHVKNVEEMINIIGSCKLFIGNASAPFAIASALNVNRIIESANYCLTWDQKQSQYVYGVKNTLLRKGDVQQMYEQDTRYYNNITIGLLKNINAIQ